MLFIESRVRIACLSHAKQSRLCFTDKRAKACGFPGFEKRGCREIALHEQARPLASPSWSERLAPDATNGIQEHSALGILNVCSEVFKDILDSSSVDVTACLLKSLLPSKCFNRRSVIDLQPYNASKCDIIEYWRYELKGRIPILSARFVEWSGAVCNDSDQAESLWSTLLTPASLLGTWQATGVISSAAALMAKA